MAESWKKMMASGSYVHQGFETIHVGNISPKVTPERLKICFETFGPVVYVSIRQTGTQYSTYQYGFVTFEKESDAEKALSDPHHSVHFEGIKVNPVKRWNQPAEDRIRCPMDQISILDLNDDCLIQIASKLSFLDLLRLSQVCQRFKYIADFQFSKCKNLDARLFRECNSMEIREIMSRVGPYVQKVKCSDIVVMDEDEMQEYLDCLPQFCSNIRTFECVRPRLNYDAYRNMFRAFKKLTVLSLPDCYITDDICQLISNCENIENLNLSGNPTITGKYLHKLIKLKILNLRSCRNLQSLHFNELLANIKLESLNIENCVSLDSSSIEHILRHQTGLVSLSVAKGSGTPDLHPLAKLKSLKNLEVWIDHSDLILEELAFHNTGLEKLEITCGIYGMQLKASQKEAILNLKNLKELCIQGIDDSFLNQIASRTSVRHLCCAECHFHGNVTSDGILNLIRISNTIEKIGISARQFEDELFFKAIDILKEKQRATRLTFVICHSYTEIIEWMQMHPKIMENSHLVDFKCKSDHSHSDFDF